MDIQGKKRENYKIRVNGAQSQEQLEEIIEFMTILLWLYMDTYIVKNPERLQIKTKLKSLTNIAKRRNRVEDVIEVSRTDPNNNIKEMTKMDQDRIGSKNNKTKEQWARLCQSTENMNRRPSIHTEKTFEQLVRQGYKLNPKSGDYERTVTVTQSGKKKNVTIVAAKFTGETNIYYTCSPEENKEYTYVGFLSRSSDNNMCIPCCFKKDAALSKNKYKRNFHLQCMGKNNDGEEYNTNVFGDKLYILQDTNKMLPGRYGYMYKYLDYYFNSLLKKTKVVKNNYLMETNTGYYMKFGSKQDEFPFLNAVSSCLDIPFETIKSNIKKAIKEEVLWTYANSGDLKTQFGDRKRFIETLDTNLELDHQLVDDIISVPGVLVPNGLNIYIFEKKEYKNRTDFILLCKNIENMLYYNDILRTNIILIKEGLNYYPIMLIQKNTKEKQISILGKFKFEHEIIEHISKYTHLSCKNISFDSIKIKDAKNIYYALFANSKTNIIPVSQYIDTRNKCKYLFTKDGNIIPTKPSGILHHLPIVNTLTVKSIRETLDFIENISTLIGISSKGFVYTNKNNNTYTIESIIIEPQISVPVLSTKMTIDELEELLPNYLLEEKSLYEIIDEEINKGPENYEVDKRIKVVKQNEYLEEHYELFRYELSNYLNLSIAIKNKIIKILNSNSPNKKNQIKQVLLKITSDEMFQKYGSILDEPVDGVKEHNNSDNNSDNNSEYSDNNSEYSDNNSEYSDSDDEMMQQGGAHAKFIEVNDAPVDYNNYIAKNNRDLCMHHKNTKDCGTNIHCTWNRHCLFKISAELLAEFISKVSNELVNNTLKSAEILNEGNYFVLDVINIDNYTYRKGQKIIKSDNMNIKKILGEIFGKSNIPVIGRRKIFRTSKTVQEENYINQMEIVGDHKYQTIINNNALFRAYSNCIYWYKNSMSDDSYRNLGYYSDLQTELANTFKSYIYTWVNNERMMKDMYQDLKDILNIELNIFIEEYRTKLFMEKEFYYLGIVDLYILNRQHSVPIVLYDFYNTVFLIIDNGIVYNNFELASSKTFNEKYLVNSIKIKYKMNKITINGVPELLQVIY